jgi:hypothetical protein
MIRAITVSKACGLRWFRFYTSCFSVVLWISRRLIAPFLSWSLVLHAFITFVLLREFVFFLFQNVFFYVWLQSFKFYRFFYLCFFILEWSEFVFLLLFFNLLSWSVFISKQNFNICLFCVHVCIRHMFMCMFRASASIE